MRIPARGRPLQPDSNENSEKHLRSRRPPPSAAPRRPAGGEGAPNPPLRLGVEVAASRRFPGLRRRRIATLVAEAARRLGVEGGEVSIRLADDEEMADLHRRYKGIEGPTDVLTFDLSGNVRPKKPGGCGVDVEIVIGAEVARREALDRGLEVETEVLLYAVHGLLHCLGEDDHDAAAARRMHRREDRVLSAMGLGAAYRARRRASPVKTMMQRRRRVQRPAGQA